MIERFVKWQIQEDSYERIYDKPPQDDVDRPFYYARAIQFMEDDLGIWFTASDEDLDAIFSSLGIAIDPLEWIDKHTKINDEQK